MWPDAVAQAAGWSYNYTQNLAAEMTEPCLIESDMGLGCLPTLVEARERACTPFVR